MKLLRRFFPKKYCIFGTGNSIFVNGQLCIKKINGLNVYIKGNNNTIKINDISYIRNADIHILANNSYIEIGKKIGNIKSNIDPIIISLNIQINRGEYQKCIIGNNCFIGGCNIYLGGNNVKCEIGDYCVFSNNINIWPSDTHTLIDKTSGAILNMPTGLTIGNNCWVGQGVYFAKSGSIADNTIIGMGSVITKNFADKFTAIAGNPAKVIRINVDFDFVTPDQYEIAPPLRLAPYCYMPMKSAPIKTDLNQTPKVFLASFGDSRMKNSAARLISQAAAIDCFDEIYVMDERNLTPEFYDKFKDRLSIHSRGFGYWCWKPQAIKQVMDIMNDGDILLFCDIGCHLNEARRNEMLNLIERARNSSSGILAFSFSPDYTDGHWSKGDLLDYFGVRGRADITANPQLVGGVFFLRKNQLVVNMLNEWLKVFNDNFSLSDDTPSVSKNLDGFVENRHDQSIFSILAKLNKADIIAEDHFLNYTKMSESDWEKLSFPIQARRDKN